MVYPPHQPQEADCLYSVLLSLFLQFVVSGPWNIFMFDRQTPNIEKVTDIHDNINLHL